MEEIIALTVEDPDARKTLLECDCVRILTEDSSEPKIAEWVSKVQFALNNEDVHQLWSNVMMGAVSEYDMQHLVDMSVPRDRGHAQRA